MRIVGCLLVVMFSANLWAQEKAAPDLSRFRTTNQKLQALAEYADQVIILEDYLKLREIGRKGLRMAPKNEYGYQSVFAFYIGVTFSAEQSDSAIYYLQKSERFGRQAKNKKRVLEALKQLLHASDNYGKNDIRERALDSLVKMADTMRNASEKAGVFENIASYYTDKGQYETSMRYYLDGLKERRRGLHKADETDSINFGVQLINIGEIYLSMKQPQKAIEYIAGSDAFFTNYKLGRATLYKDYCESYLMLGQPAKAKKYYNILAAFTKKAGEPDCWSVLISCDLIFAGHYLARKDSGRASQYVRHAQGLALKYADSFLRAEVDYMAGEVYLALKQYRKALDYFDKCEPVLKDGNTDIYAALQKSLSEANAGIGNYPEAYKHAALYAKLQDTLLTEAAKKNLSEMEARYQNKDKQQRINSLSAENTIKNLQIKNAEKQRWFFIVGLLLLFGIVASLVVIYRNKQKSGKLLEQKNVEMNKLNENLEKANLTKAKLFSIISHDMRSPISQLSQFLDLQQFDPEMFSEADKIRHNERISKAAETILETLEDLLIWSKTQMQQFTVSRENINARQCIESIGELVNTALSKKKIRLVVSIDPGIYLQSDRNILIIIIRNLLQNAIAHSPENSTIAIAASHQPGVTKISIADEGSGMPENLIRIFTASAMAVDSGHSGLGLTIVKEMAALLKVGVEISGNVPTGTVFTVSVPDIA